ncbi:MAG TPA: hypothetical protein VNO33_08425, partial [Kofleriaceae bacterium]|nr:hypothetical protein [Kofleriaceae bacterium]
MYRSASRPVLLALLAATACGGGAAAPAASEPARAAEAEAEAAPSTLRYVVLTMGRKSGNAEITTEPGGARRFALKVVENGRGPQCRGTLEYRADGMLARVEISGRDTMGKDAAESFDFDGARARWSNLAEKGEREVSGAAFYYTASPPLASLAGMVRALEKGGGKLALLPEGEARLESVGDQTVKREGATQTVHGHAILGLGLSPTFVWTDDAGEVFAVPTSWQSWLRDGWGEDALAQLLAAQNRFLD